MLSSLIKDQIILVKKPISWQEAIKLSCKPLLESKAIEPSYVSSIINSINKMGPYICITPGFAMPHARPEDGVNKLAMSVLISKYDVKFSDQKTAKVFITLAAIDNDSHIEYIQKLMNLIANDLNSLKKATTKEKVKKIINKY